ncbi:MAG: response regulator transcription factor [Crocinitomicaceae bacterium]|nr:response regulator transcription factor [Crocinitomicaceae bacterium]
MLRSNVVFLDPDSDFTNSLIDKIKKRIDYNFSYYPSFEDAKSDVVKNPPDVIFIEQNLNGISGLDAIPLLKSLNPGTEIVMVSNQNDLKVVDKAFELGALKYFRKDILLIDHIEEVLKERQIPSWKKLFA